MNKYVRYLGLLAILPVLTVAVTSNFVEVDAVKSQGKPLLETSSKKVCGDHLCSMHQDKQKMKEEKPMEEKMEKSMEEKMEVKEMIQASSALKLAGANIAAKIPLHLGWYNGEAVYYIVTDSSEQSHADIITKAQGWKVELSPPLAKTPAASLDPVYIFTNGVEGTGIHGFQGEVFASTPAQHDKYSAIRSHVHVTWNEGQTPTVLDSVEKIVEAEKEGKVVLKELPVILNMPQIVWPGGQMQVKEDKTLTDETPYGGGQILDINTEKMTVTFIAHRGWGPDGRTIYYIVTDAIPEGPAMMMGVVNTPTLAPTLASPSAVDLYQFTNGLAGTGPLGFQPGIAAAAPGDETYSPLWRISVITWNDSSSASLLQTIGDINAARSAGKLNIELARPMNSDHVVNCPFIDPFQ